MITDINSEDRLVQQTFADHLDKPARLGKRPGLQRRGFRTTSRVGSGLGARGRAGANLWGVVRLMNGEIVL